MIVSTGLTPAWQQIMTLGGLRLGEVNRAHEVCWCASGKAPNVALAAAHLGADVTLVAPAGGAPRQPMFDEISSLGIHWECIPTRSSTRVCTTLIDQERGTITELVENGRPLEPDEIERLVEAHHRAARGADGVVITGSLPEGTPLSTYRQLIEGVGCPVVCDFRTGGLLDVLPLRPWVVKPNREELERTLDIAIDSDGKLLAAMRELNRRGAQWVVITQGSGPVCVTSTTEAYRLDTLRPETVVNTIGSGDAMAGTLAWAAQQGTAMPEAVALAIAAATENCEAVLPCRLDPLRVTSRAQSVTIAPWTARETPLG